MEPFKPKQCLPPEPAFFTQLAGDTCEQVARRLLKFIPPIAPGSIIHDNACGVGAMTEAVLESNVQDVSIVATDIVPQVVEQVQKKVADNGWPVKAKVMPSEALTFPDAEFTHSLTNLGIMVIEGDAAAGGHIYRTLKDGGLAVLSIWDKPLPVQVVTAAHCAARPHDHRVPVAIKRGGFDDKDLRTVLEGAGFKADTIRFERTYAVLEVKDLRLWASAVWSFLGCPETGWSQDDEDNWDKVIDIMIDWLKKYEGYKELDNGLITFTMPAHVAITTK